jgi:hypothetical protein
VRGAGGDPNPEKESVMAMTSNPVLRALARWVQKGLLTEETAQTLIAESEEDSRREGQRWTQFALAATGGAILIIAGATFLAWAWPEMGYGGQSVSLGIVGALIVALGVRLLGPPQLIPVAYLLQLSGPFLLLMALAYSENAWADRTPGGVVAGVLSLGLPFVLVILALRKDPVLGALQAALSFLFFFLFLDRALGLDLRTSLWVMDGIGLVGLAWLAYRLRDAQGPPWVLNTFFAVLYASLLLAFFTGDILWDLEEFVIIPIDIWLLAVAGISLWALQEGIPVHLQTDWYERQLAYCIIMAIPCGFVTTLDAMKAGPNLAAVTVAGIGVLGLWFSVPRRVRSVLIASCLALLVAAWYYGAEKAGALGAVLALTLMAGVLFWAASRLGPRRVHPIETNG